MEGVHKIVWLMIVVNFVSLLYTIHFLLENFSTIKMSSTRLAGKKVTHCLYILHTYIVYVACALYSALSSM